MIGLVNGLPLPGPERWRAWAAGPSRLISPVAVELDGDTTRYPKPRVRDLHLPTSLATPVS
jgi:hypothetical protein|uniref:Uncharacterized protein n=1 Tax=Oryza barthii TaxID=65489 RepID=A0A0D3G2T3_9ORYZ